MFCSVAEEEEEEAAEFQAYYIRIILRIICVKTFSYPNGYHNYFITYK
jgi:hypothetical protein